MSKITPLPRIDRDYQKNLKFPDINDFLKDTSYLEVTSALQDNQSHVVLQPKSSNSVAPVLMQNFIVDGVKRLFYMTPIEFYGYNPDLESVERAELTVEFLEATVPRKTQLLYRGDGDDRIVTLPGQRAAGNGDNLYNYKIQLSVATVESILTWVFNTQKTLAQGYYAGDYRNLQQFIDSDFYTMVVPVTFRMYYFNATEAAIVYNTSLAFGSLTTVLRSSLTATSATAYPYVYSPGDFVFYRPTKEYLTLKATFAAPITSDALWLTATLSGVGTNASEKINVIGGALNTRTGLLRNAVAKGVNSGYSTSYPTVSFTYSANSEAFTGNTSISGAALTSFTPVKFLPLVHSLKIIDYFIGHPTTIFTSTNGGVPADSSNFHVKISFTAPKNVIDATQEKTFMLEFIQPDNPKTETYDAVGQVSTIVQKTKLMIRGSLPNAAVGISRTAQYESSYTAASGTLGYIYKSAYFDETGGVYNCVVQKIFNEARNEAAYSHINLSKFTATLTPVKSASAIEDAYVLSIKWDEPNVAQALFLTAELPIIRLHFGDFMYQLYAQATFTKSIADNYTRVTNPFYYYSDTNRTLRWYPRMSSVLVNGAPLAGLVKGGVTALDATTVSVPATANFFKLALTVDQEVLISYVMHVYCRGYFDNPLLLLSKAPILNRDAKGFRIPYIRLPSNSSSTVLASALISAFTTILTKNTLNNLNITLNKSPRSYFLTNLKLVTLADKSTYYTYSYTGANVPQCDIGFYYDKI
jgi:hypothetical protein